MANKFTDAVFNIQLPGESRNRVVLKAILMAVAWRTDNKSGLCWPSYARIAAKPIFPGVSHLQHCPYSTTGFDSVQEGDC